MLDIQLNLLLFEIVTFLVLLFLLNRILFKPLLAHIDGRFASLSNDSRAITANLDEAARLRAEAEAVIAQAKREGHTKIETAVNSAKSAAAAAVESEKEKVAGELSAFEASLASETESLKNVLLASKGEFAAAAGQKVRG